MNATKDLVKAILEKPNHYNWSIQGLGMARIYLTADASLRLHIWHDRFRVPGVSDIHNHPWDFESTVIAGRIDNKRYAERDEGEPYSKVNILCGVGMTPNDTIQHVALTGPYTASFTRGDVYEQRASEIHSTEFKNGTVTLIRRTFKDDPDHADVFFPRGEQFVSAEPSAATDEEIQLAIESALELMR